MSTAFKDLHPVPEAFNFLGGEITAQSSYSDIAGQSLDTFHWASYHNISVTDSPELPSRHHYFLLQPYLPGFTLHDKTWSKSYRGQRAIPCIIAKPSLHVASRYI